MGSGSPLTPGLDIFSDGVNRLQINLDVNKQRMNGADTEYGLRVQLQQLI